jgi:prepilin-type N-terminal cleavage/methylation domain-containing protein
MKLRTRRFRRGLSLVEVMLATSIAATLLTATGAAWVASTNAVEINDRTATGLRAVSTSLLQITNAIRRCQACQVYSDHIDLITFDNHNYSYYYVSSSQQLQFVDKDVTPNTVYPMSGNVTGVTFNYDTAPNPQTQVSCVVHVSISVTVSINSCPFTLSAGAAPRSNINY